MACTWTTCICWSPRCPKDLAGIEPAVMPSIRPLPGCTAKSRPAIVESALSKLVTIVLFSIVFFFAAGSVVAELTPPDHPAIGFSDHAGVSVSTSRVRFLRPIEGQGFEHCAPGARVRFNTDSVWIKAHLYFNDLMTREDTYNGVVSILVDGKWHADFDPGAGRGAFYFSPIIRFWSRERRTIEIVLPYGAGVDFVGLSTRADARLQPSEPRPARRIVVFGDSITQGYRASSYRSSWPFILGQSKTAEVVNLGFGSRATHADDGLAVGQFNADQILVALGHNDFRYQSDLATLRARYQELLEHIRSGNRTAAIFAITPLWTSLQRPIPVSRYRTAIADAVAATTDPGITLINGLTLTAHGDESFTDGTHPNDIGSATIAKRLSELLD